MTSNLRPKSRQTNLVVQELENEILIYDLTQNKALCLNEISALVWQICDGEKSISQITDEASKKLNTTINEDLIWLTLNELEKENLLEKSEIPSKFNGLSRREVIKQVGLSTAAALPIINSLIAPKAALSISFCNDAGTVINWANPSFDASVCYNEAQMQCSSGMATFNSNTCSITTGCTCVVTCRC